jgi:DNA-binding response OmpR family regulator
MKIVILNEELRSEMQIYLALANHHEVEIAADVNDLYRLMDEEPADLVFLDLDSLIEDKTKQEKAWQTFARLRTNPKAKVVAICDRSDFKLCGVPQNRNSNTC